MGTAILTADPTKASKAISEVLHKSPAFENLGYGRWRMIEQMAAA